jgi:SET domain-containing protein
MSSSSSSSCSSLFNEAVDLDKIASSPLRIRKSSQSSSQTTRVIDNTIQQSTKEV